jgi:hypothetical protein
MQRQVKDADTAAFLSVVDECEFARYSPSSGGQAMAHLYQAAAQVIGNLEQQIK